MNLFYRFLSEKHLLFEMMSTLKILNKFEFKIVKLTYFNHSIIIFKTHDCID
jgi:hypothetical protein